MKNKVIVGFLSLFAYYLHGQPSTTPISIAYFSQFGIEPGVKISTELEIGRFSKYRNLFVSPQISYFVRPKNNSNLFLAVDIGSKRQKEDKSSFSAFSIGLGYLHQFQISAIAVQLGDGKQSTTRTGKHYFLPTVNYAFGNRLSEKLNWYSKIGVGQRFGGEISSSTTILMELGLRFHL